MYYHAMITREGLCVTLHPGWECYESFTITPTEITRRFILRDSWVSVTREQFCAVMEGGITAPPREAGPTTQNKPQNRSPEREVTLMPHLTEEELEDLSREEPLWNPGDTLRLDHPRPHGRQFSKVQPPHFIPGDFHLPPPQSHATKQITRSESLKESSLNFLAQARQTKTQIQQCHVTQPAPRSTSSKPRPSSTPHKRRTANATRWKP